MSDVDKLNFQKQTEMQDYKFYHENLPLSLRKYWNDRGINNESIKKCWLGFNGKALTIPVFDNENNFLFFKYRRLPEKEDGPKYWYEAGTKAQLYNSAILKTCKEVVIVEGEADCILLNQHGISAVTSTGGAGTFEDEWIELFNGVQVFICMDNDTAGQRAAVNLLFAFPGAKLISFPKDYKDVTDYFLGPTPKTFAYCMLTASLWPELKLTENLTELNALIDKLRTKQLPYGTDWVRSLAVPIMQELRKEVAIKNSPVKKRHITDNTSLIEWAKKIPITDLYKGNLRKMGNVLAGICPFHKEKTASFRIYPGTNTWHCFGCDAGNDTIDFVMKRDSVDFNEALKKLKQ